MSNYFDMNQYERYEGDANKSSPLGAQSIRTSADKCFSQAQNTKASATCASDPADKPKQINNKRRCGTFIPQSGSKAYKTENMNYNAFFSSQSVYSALCQRKVKKCRRNNLEYTHLRQNYVEMIFGLAERFKISAISSHLAVSLMDSLYYTTSQYNAKLELYAPVCLLLAAKTVEFDGRIPTIPKLRRAVGTEFSVEEYKKAEMVLLENVDWNPQFTSNFEFVQFFLSQGVVYSSDGYNALNDEKEVLKDNTQALNQQFGGVKASIIAKLKGSSESSKAGEQPTSERIRIKYTNILKPIASATNGLTKIGLLEESRITEIVSKIEETAAKLCRTVVKEMDLIETDPVVLACACIAYLRKINRFTSGWCEELEELTGVSGDAVSPVLDLLHKLLDKHMAPDQTFLSLPSTERYHSKETPICNTAISLIEYRQSEEQASTIDQISEVNVKDSQQAVSLPCSLTSLDSTNSGGSYGTEPSSLNSLRKNETSKTFQIRKIAPVSHTVIPNNDPVRVPVRRATNYRIQTNKTPWNFSGKSSMSRPPMQPVVVIKSRPLNQHTRNSILGSGAVAKQQLASDYFQKRTNTIRN